MEQEYWLRRTRESLAKAGKAASAEARLIHLDLAGRYSVRAAGYGSCQSEMRGVVSTVWGIDETQLEALIPHFYARVREDALNPLCIRRRDHRLGRGRRVDPARAAPYPPHAAEIRANA